MSRTPNSRKHETHERILDVAARAIRRHGYAGVGVADVMKEAGLTHGGFYAHFDSRDALIIEALERAGRDSGEAVNRALERRAAKGVSAFRRARRGLPRRRAPGVARDRLSGRRAGVRHATPVGCRCAKPRPCACGGWSPACSRRCRAHRAPPASVVAGTLVGTLQLARALGANADGRAGALGGTQGARPAIRHTRRGGSLSAAGPTRSPPRLHVPRHARSRI
jgi:AcrR family transcriptional regulator